MSEVCAMTDYVNCKYRERSFECLTHDRRGPSVQSTKPQPYIPLAQRRKKHEPKPRAPKCDKLIFKTLVDIKGPQFYTGRFPTFHVGMKRFVHMLLNDKPSVPNCLHKSKGSGLIYVTISGVAKSGSGIEIKDRVL